MMQHRIVAAEALEYPMLRITFEDGVSGEFDLTREIADGAVFAPLKDEALFREVSVGEYGRTFGWRLNELGQEIDFCPDAARIRIETQIVEQLADRFRARRTAAE